MTKGASEILKKFILQAYSGELKTATYPKQLGDFRMQVSFGMGSPARVPWIAFTAPEMKVSNGFYPVYLYYKNDQILILAYGVSETEEYGESWPVDVQNRSNTIKSFFGKEVPRYGDSFVFKAYKLSFSKHSDTFYFSNVIEERSVDNKELEGDLQTILEYYNKAVFHKVLDETSSVNRGLFYMEKQLEDFLIHNWGNTELGKRFDLIIEEGDLRSQQYRTDVGPIDILVKDKKTRNYVVIELKRNQTSDDTVGQLARYMGWVKNNLNDPNVKGVVIAGQYDSKLDYALKMLPNAEVFLYYVDFKLSKFSREK